MVSVYAGLTGLTHLDLFGAKITDSGTSYLRCTSYQFYATIGISLYLSLSCGTFGAFLAPAGLPLYPIYYPLECGL